MFYPEKLSFHTVYLLKYYLNYHLLLEISTYHINLTIFFINKRDLMRLSRMNKGELFIKYKQHGKRLDS